MLDTVQGGDDSVVNKRHIVLPITELILSEGDRH